MQKEEIKQNLIKATKQLLIESPNPEKVTSRLISAKAGTNLAMINYCFKSKDELLSTAVGEIIMESAGNQVHYSNTAVPPLKRLWDMLWELCLIVLKFQKFTRVSVPYILLQSPIEAPMYILPILHEYFGDKKSESECRIIAYELISFMQLIFYREDDFIRYCGIDIRNDADIKPIMKSILKTQFNLFFKEGFDYE